MARYGRKPSRCATTSIATTSCNSCVLSLAVASRRPAHRGVGIGGAEERSRWSCGVRIGSRRSVSSCRSPRSAARARTRNSPTSARELKPQQIGVAHGRLRRRSTMRARPVEAGFAFAQSAAHAVELWLKSGKAWSPIHTRRPRCIGKGQPRCPARSVR